MAQVSFEGYVQDRRGKMLRVSEEYRKRDDQGNWSNDGYGDFTVWLKDEDSQPEVQAGAVVLVSGNLKVTKAEKEGRTYTNLNVGFAKVGVTRLTQKYAGSALQAPGGSNVPSAGDWSSAPVPSPQAGVQGFSDETPF